MQPICGFAVTHLDFTACFWDPHYTPMSEVNQRKRPKSNSIDVEPTSKKPRLESEAQEPEVIVAEPVNEPEPEVSNDLYLDTVNRQFLDFDFEKLCSVSLSNLNVYACLVCGKYYQGQNPDAE